MAKVFISYRREDAAGWTGRITDQLSQQFGADQVFMDVEDIVPGEDFSEVIRSRLEDIEVLIAVIGQGWLGATDGDGNLRLAQEDDFVRREIAAALVSDTVRVVPVLVEGVTMPSADQLPPDLAALSMRQAVEVSQTRFRADIERLSAAIRGEEAPPSLLDRIKQGASLPVGWVLLAAVVIGVVVGVVVLGGGGSTDPIVPGVVGFSDVQAVQVLADLGIEFSVETRESDTVAGQVIEQDPGAGERSQGVQLVVSGGLPVPQMPDVVGVAQEDAESTLDAARIDHNVERANNELDVGLVFDQIPAPGTRTEFALLLVSTGRELPTLPDVVGDTITDARAKIPSGVTVTEQLEESETAVRTVLEQDPRGGERSDVVELVVSAGPGLPVVPEVVGLAVDAAQTALAELDISMEIATEAAPQPEGTVIGQDPATGARADRVTVRVSDGPTIVHYVGNWVNIDNETGGMTRLEIARANGGATFHGFASCSPRDCDWGTINVLFTESRLVGTYDFGFKRTTIRAELAGNLLLVETFDDYAEGDSRADRITTYVFVSEQGQITLAGLLEVVALAPEMTTAILKVRPDFASTLTEVSLIP